MLGDRAQQRLFLTLIAAVLLAAALTIWGASALIHKTGLAPLLGAGSLLALVLRGVLWRR